MFPTWLLIMWIISYYYLPADPRDLNQSFIRHKGTNVSVSRIKVIVRLSSASIKLIIIWNITTANI